MIITTAAGTIELLTTTEAVDVLGVSLDALQGMLRRRRITPPAKDGSGRLLWTPEDLENARRVIAGVGEIDLPS